MSTLRQDILDYADKNNTFELWQILQHLKKIRRGYDASKTLTMIEKMTSAGDLVKSPIDGAVRPRFRYGRAV